MHDALAAASPYLLEPIAHVTIHAPGTATSKVTSSLSSRRARVLGMNPREGWSRWDTIEAEVPEAELTALATDLRSASQGMATFETRFDHLAECTGRVAEQIVQRVAEPA
jgi:elongation factor G